MAKRWSLKEDIIICKYCMENPWAYSSDIEIEWMQSQLENAGCEPRSFGAVRKRAYTYDAVLREYELPYTPEQVIYVYSELAGDNRKNYQGIKSYIREVYKPDHNDDSIVDDKISSLFGDTSNLLGYKHTIDYASTFPMVLQKYVDLKGIRKHNVMCKRIGMKPDTFSAILRGKYKEVKKENVLKLCIGLELNIEQANELLNSAGYVLSNAVMTDVVIKAFLWDRIYSVVAINAELYENNEPMLFDNYVIEY